MITVYRLIDGQMVPLQVDDRNMANQGVGNLDGKLSAEVLNDKMRNENRNMLAIVRVNESQLMLNGLNEIRQALCYGQVAHNDTGSGERPPVQPIFNEDNQKKLQFAYLNLWMRYSNYVDEAMKEMKVTVPKDVKENE